MKTTRFMKRCRGCGVVTSVLGALTRIERAPFQVFTLVDGTNLEWDNGSVVVACRGCGNKLRAVRIVGKLSTKHTCGTKCLESTGFLCECSCGGRNHGAGYEVVRPEAA